MSHICISVAPPPLDRRSDFGDDPRSWDEWKNLARRVGTSEGDERERMLNRLDELLRLAQWQHRAWGVL